MRKLFLLFVFILSGCAATGPAFKPAENIDPNSALVYVYREKAWEFSARSAYFYINDINVFDLYNEGYSWVSLPPGKYNITQKWGIDTGTKPIGGALEVRSGEIRYLSFQAGSCPAGYRQMCLSWSLREQSPEVGKSAIVDKRFQDNFGQQKLIEELRSK